MIWSDEQKSRLTFLWEQTSMIGSEIGREIGVSKNAVIGQAHRLGLKQRNPRRATIEPREPLRFPPSGQCQWIENHVGDPSFHFCGKPVAKAGESWCAEHWKRVYLRTTPLNEAAE